VGCESGVGEGVNISSKSESLRVGGVSEMSNKAASDGSNSDANGMVDSGSAEVRMRVWRSLWAILSLVKASWYFLKCQYGVGVIILIRW